MVHVCAGSRERTFSALIICSGAIVFFDSCSHISFASEDIKCMNSVTGHDQLGITGDARDVFTYTTFDNKISRLLRARDVLWEVFCKHIDVSRAFLALSTDQVLT